jgi:hypothetical protein
LKDDARPIPACIGKLMIFATMRGVIADAEFNGEPGR